MKVLKFEDKPRIVFFAGNNLVSDCVLNFLRYDVQENVVKVFEEKDTIDIKDVIHSNPDIMITCYWPYLFSKEMINIPKLGIINFHPAMLPKNRGWYPSVWPLLDGSPAGVTLHLIDEGADTGPIIAQEEIKIEETDTGGSIYKKSQYTIFSLFKRTWLELYNGIELKEQDNTYATYHSKKDANELDEIDLSLYNVKFLLALLRAKRFGIKSYAYYKKNDKKYYVYIDIKESNE